MRSKKVRIDELFVLKNADNLDCLRVLRGDMFLNSVH